MNKYLVTMKTCACECRQDLESYIIVESEDEESARKAHQCEFKKIYAEECWFPEVDVHLLNFEGNAHIVYSNKETEKKATLENCGDHEKFIAASRLGTEPWLRYKNDGNTIWVFESEKLSFFYDKESEVWYKGEKKLSYTPDVELDYQRHLLSESN
jgi:hypothetical protein